MGVLGIIVEYNPFHNGHLYHLNKAKSITGADYTVAIMSGNFTQRGLPANLDKFTRTQLALYYGVDMVVELPVIYATSSANYFASGAINLLNAIGVDYLCFGAENSDINILKKLAETEEDELYKSTIKKYLSEGMSFATSKEKATLQANPNFINMDGLFSSNSILGTEYLRALKMTNSAIYPYAIQRDSSFVSATLINKCIINNIQSCREHVPNKTYLAIINFISKNNKPINLDSFSSIFHYQLIKYRDIMPQFLGVDEGIENRLLEKAYEHYNLSHIIMAIKTKRYPLAKLQRMVTHIILDIKKEDIKKNSTPPYVRVLGFKGSSQHLFKKISYLPIITNVKNARKVLDDKGYSLLKKDIFATDMYYIGQGGYKNKRKQKKLEYTAPIII